MISGTTVATGQLRHKTITDTSLDQPDRSQVPAAKVIVADLTGTLSGLLAAGITTAAAAGFTAARGITSPTPGTPRGNHHDTPRQTQCLSGSTSTPPPGNATASTTAASATSCSSSAAAPSCDHAAATDPRSARRGRSAGRRQTRCEAPDTVTELG
jgi:hypothetical protein